MRQRPSSTVEPRLSAEAQQQLFAYALVLPVVLLLLGLVGYPLFYAIYVSFTNMVVGGGGDWIGLANFRYLAGSAAFASAIRNTIVLVVVSDAVQAGDRAWPRAARQRAHPGRGLFRSFLMLPWAMPAFVAFLTWRVLYQPIGGGINLVLTQTGLYPDIVDWLGQRSTAMPAVIAASVWRGFPFWFISILAALQNIPAELYEAARVDGANAWQRFLRRHLPGHPPGGDHHRPAVLHLDRELLRTVSGC